MLWSIYKIINKAVKSCDSLESCVHCLRSIAHIQTHEIEELLTYYHSYDVCSLTTLDSLIVNITRVGVKSISS